MHIHDRVPFPNQLQSKFFERQEVCGAAHLPGRVVCSVRQRAGGLLRPEEGCGLLPVWLRLGVYKGAGLDFQRQAPV